jgi:hypothetical protein
VSLCSVFFFKILKKCENNKPLKQYKVTNMDSVKQFESEVLSVKFSEFDGDVNIHTQGR